MPRCARCSGFGHEESACPSDPTILVMELPDDDSEEEKVFAANATGKCSLRISEEVGDGELDKQVAQYIADSGATCHLTPDADDLTNYRECSRSLGLTDSRKISIAGYDDLTLAFRSNDSWVHVKLHNVAHAPLLSYNLVSLTSLTQEGHPSAVEKSGVTLKLKRGGTVQFLLIGKLCRQYGYRPEAAGRTVDTACAVIASGQAKAPTTPTDINIFYCTYGHTRNTAQPNGETARSQPQRGASRVPGVLNCKGATGAHRQVDGSPSRFIDLSGKMVAPSIGGKRYTLIVRDDHTRFTRVYFLAKKSDVASAFESFLAKIRVDGTPSAVMCVRSDNGGRIFRRRVRNFMPQTWHQTGIYASRQPQVQRCSRTSPSTDQGHCPRRTHASSGILPRCTTLHVIVGRSGVSDMQLHEPHCNQSTPREQLTIRDVVRFTSPRRGSMAFPQTGHLQSREIKYVTAESTRLLLRRTQRQPPPRLHASSHYPPHHTAHPQCYLATRPSCPSRAPAALAPHCRRGGVYSGGGRERGGRVSLSWREGGRVGQRVRPRHDGGGARPTRNAQGTSGRSWSRNWGSGGRQFPGTIDPLQKGRNRQCQRQQQLQQQQRQQQLQR